MKNLGIILGGGSMKCKCERCGFEIVMSSYKFHQLCYMTPYCPACGKYMDETIEDEVE